MPVDNPDAEDESPEADEESGILRVTRRGVMQAAGAAGLLTGGAGEAVAETSCGCETVTADDSQCFEEPADEDCSYCKIDPIPENGESCTIDGTGITITVVEDSQCIEVSDPRSEVGDVALKSGRFCPCTVHENVSDGEKLCTLTDEDERCRNAISHITVEVCQVPIEVSGEVLNCTTAEADVTGLDTGDSITLEVTFLDSECEKVTKTVTDGGMEDDDPDDGEISATIDLRTYDGGRCYCTPDELIIWEGDTAGGTELGRFDPGLDAGTCEPSFTVDESCTEVTVTASDIIDGCPVTATLNYDQSECSSDTFSFTADETYTFEVPCYCTPTSIEFDTDDASDADLSGFNQTFDLSCEPTLDVTADCETVTVDASGVLSDCPIEATVTYDECADETQRISGDGTTTFNVPCYCTPESISFSNVNGGADLSNFDQEFDLSCEPTLDVTADCETVTVDASGVLSDCPIEATVTYDECGTETQTISANETYSFEVPCYCTPQDISFVNVEGGADLSNFDQEFDLSCEPTLDATADCTEVVVTASGLITDCDVEATVSYVEDDCSSETQVLSNGDNTFDVPCYCTPESISYVNTDPDGADLSGFDQTFSGLECGVTLTTLDANCQEITVEGSGVPECPVTVEVLFAETECSLEPVEFTTPSGGTFSETIDVPCYCTPTSVTVYEGSSTSDPVVQSIAPDLDCTPDFNAMFACDQVEVSGTGLIDGCPVEARLHITADPEGSEVDPMCPEATSQELTSSDSSQTFDLSGLECGCEPEKVEFYTNGRRLETKEAGDLNCICTDFTDVCRIEEGQIEALCDGNDVTVDCGTEGQITFESSEAECEDDELICFNFTSTFEVFRVFVKGGGGRDTGNEYIWSCGTFDSDDPEPDVKNFETDGQTYDGKLCANENPNNNKQTAVSHIDFSVCAEDLD